MRELVLPYPPSANRLWTRTRRGMRRTDEYKSWIEECQLATIRQRGKPIESHYCLNVVADRPDKRRRDLDNLLKPVSDGLVHSGVIPDDHMCVAIQAAWDDCPELFETIKVRLTK